MAVAVLALAMPAATPPAWAGAGRWTPAGGPPGGWITLLARAPGTPGTLYASVFQAGVFRSTDDGATWTALRAGLPPAASPAILAVDAHHPLTVFAAYQQPGATYRTDDGGQAWALQTGGPFTSAVSAIAFGTADPARAYASSAAGIFSSDDGGTTWQLASGPGSLPFLPGATICLGVDPRNGDRLLVGSFFGLFLSTDRGATWTTSAMLPPDSVEQFAGVEFDPTSPDMVFAWTPVGVLRSFDGGATFRPAGLDHALVEGQSIFGLVVSADGSRIYAGIVGDSFLFGAGAGHAALFQIFQRALGQPLWQPAGPPVPVTAMGVLAADPVNPAGLLAGTVGRGVLRSADGGATWRDSSLGIGGRLLDLAADPSAPARFYAIDSLGTLWRSADGGADWTALAGNIGGPLAIDPRRPRTLYSAAPSRSDDGGLHWQSLDPHQGTLGDPFFCLEWTKLAVDPVADSTLYMVMQGSNALGCHNPGSFVLESADGGRHWASVIEPGVMISDIAVGAKPAAFERPPGRTAVYLLDFNAVVRSRDSGRTWSRQPLGLSPAGQTVSMTVSPDGQALYVDTGSEGLFRSQDGATTWQHLDPPPATDGSPLRLALDPLHPSTLYVLANQRFFRSLDGGASWTEFSAGLRFFVPTGPLAVDRLHPGRVLAASANSGVIEIVLPPAP